MTNSNIATACFMVLFSMCAYTADDVSLSTTSDDQIDNADGSSLTHKYIISPRVSRNVWPADSNQLESSQFASTLPIFYLLGSPSSQSARHQISLRSASKLGYVPQARVGRRAAPMGLMPMPRVGRSDRSLSSSELGEIAQTNVNDSTFNDALESLIYNQ